MISPTPPDPAVTFVVDPDAEPGNVLPALVRLLIGIRAKRRARAAAELAGEQNPAQPDTPNP